MLVVPKYRWDEKGVWLQLVTCCAKAASSFALSGFAGIESDVDNDLEATVGPSRSALVWH